MEELRRKGPVLFIYVLMHKALRLDTVFHFKLLLDMLLEFMLKILEISLQIIQIVVKALRQLLLHRHGHELI